MEQELCCVIPKTHLARQLTALSCGSHRPLLLQAGPTAQLFCLPCLCPTKLNWFAGFRPNYFEALASEKRENRKNINVRSLQFEPSHWQKWFASFASNWPDNFYSGIWSHLWHFRRICLGLMMLPQVIIWLIKRGWKRIKTMEWLFCFPHITMEISYSPKPALLLKAKFVIKKIADEKCSITVWVTGICHISSV